MNRPFPNPLKAIVLSFALTFCLYGADLTVEKKQMTQKEGRETLEYVFSRDSKSLFSISLYGNKEVSYSFGGRVDKVNAADVVDGTRTLFSSLIEGGGDCPELSIVIDKDILSSVAGFDNDFSAVTKVIMRELDVRMMCVPYDEHAVANMIRQAYLRTELVSSIRKSLRKDGFDSILWYDGEHPRLAKNETQRWKDVAQSDAPFHPSTSFRCSLHVFPIEKMELESSSEKLERKAFAHARVKIIETGDHFSFSAQQISVDATTISGVISQTFAKSLESGRGVWSASNGLVSVINAFECENSRIICVSGDGTVFAGARNGSDYDNGEIPFLIISNRIYSLPLQVPSQVAYPTALSFDGHIMVGAGNNPLYVGNPEPFVWSKDTGYSFIPSFCGSNRLLGSATGISSNGVVCVGSLIGSDSQEFSAFIWKKDSNVKVLETPLNAKGSYATAISADGKVVAGYYKYGGVDGKRTMPCLWNVETGFQKIVVTDEDSYAKPNSISADGSVIVGQITKSNGMDEAFVWTSQCGLWEVADIFEKDKGGIRAFDSAIGVSHDGTIVVGTGFDSNRRCITWILTIE